MGYSTRSYATGFNAGGYFPKGVRWLLIVNTALFVLYFFATVFGAGEVFSPFGLVASDVVNRFYIWQLFTYLFLHSPLGFGHILFNMLTLWMFGKDLEAAWGTERFLKYYFLCGIGAGVCVVLANYFANPFVRTIGASGAIYGVLIAFGMLFPDVQVLFSFIFPMKAKYFVALIGAITFLSSFGANTGVSNIAHLGGMVFGYAYLKTQMKRRTVYGGRRSSGSIISNLREQYQNWKLQRAKKKFQVYLKKHGGGDPWVN